ncbi:hypothetical protein RBA41_00045 [Massilia sp. CCM 9210]|uniref:hypothetical protein n=1 Tax=Massilia scottii TaxID=3057166 RepID=UPI002796CD9C|nr:hypothetical protein [Massilia sp. CCM 9210]MDQ1811688.1 hypothetical protein [Massilia sp. CCM 9210]
MRIPVSLAKSAMKPLFAGLLLLQGCASMPRGDVLKYSTHELGLLCYGGISKVWLSYAGSGHKLFDDKGDVAREKTPADAQRVPGFTSGSYKTFAGPIEMTWRSRDGSGLSHTIDLNKEIPHPRIPYDHPEQVWRENPFEGGEPTLIVEINDRTVHVYVAATLLVKPAAPAQKSFDRVKSYTLVHSRTL